MSDKISLAFCVHSHQPVGNYPYVFERGARECYLPFLETLIWYPDLKMTLHYTGPLLEWFDKHLPEFYNLINAMVERGQVEIMGGGFYEPILSVIPEDDAKRQIALTNSFVEERFRRRPRGIWCAERIWDPCLPKKIAGLGMEYTLLDDTHFLASGLNPEDIHGSYVTEREGYQLRVFPIDMRLRYTIPFKEPKEIIEYLLRLRDRGVRVVTYGDDGEKFGMWPGTWKWVYQDGWLQRFFDAMSRAASDIEVITLSDAISKYPPRGLAYLPTASYQEMMEWSLFYEQGRYYERLIKEAKLSPDWERKRAFLRGGFWDNFLSKYPESNLMHKKMLKVSALARKYGMPHKALKHLFMGQCNCGYWHGLFGGVYLSTIRHAVYENLLKAEEIIDSRRLKDKPFIVERYDYDLDGKEEILVSGKTLNCYISPHNNAAVFALEHKTSHYSLSNIMMRHPEIYHEKILNNAGGPSGHTSNKPLSIHDIPFASTEELRELLIYDRYPRLAFMTHVLTSPPDLDSLIRGRRLNTSLTADVPFELKEWSSFGDHCYLSFNYAADPLHVAKHYHYDPGGTVRLFHDISTGQEPSWLVVEWNLMVFTDAPLMKEKHVKERGVYREKEVVFEDRARNLKAVIESSVPWDIVVLPIECASQSENGFEKTFQGWSVFFIRQLGGIIPEVTLKVGEQCQS